MNCEYCGQKVEIGADVCGRCGGPNETKKPTTHKMEPYYYRGFMLWPEKDYCRDIVTYHVWLGEHRVATFEVTNYAQEAYREKFGDAVDFEPLVDKLLRLAVGDSEVEKWSELNGGKEIVFEIRRIENPTPELIAARGLIAELLR